MTEYSKLSREEQLEYHKNYNKTYYETNKEKIKLHYSHKIECEFCKRKCTVNHLKKHLKSNICFNTQKMMNERIAKINL